MAERNLENEALKTGAIHLQCERCGSERLVGVDLADRAFGEEGTATRPRGAWKVSSDGCSTCMPWAAVFPYHWTDDRRPEAVSGAHTDDVAAYTVHLLLAYAVVDLEPEPMPGVPKE